MISIFLPNAGQKLVEVGPGGALEEKPPTKKTSAYRKSSKFVATIEKSSIKNLADRKTDWLDQKRIRMYILIFIQYRRFNDVL